MTNTYVVLQRSVVQNKKAVKAEHFERMKMACAGNPPFFYKYAEQEYYHKALAHRYKGMGGWL
jgi:hypothetical protein